jgi:hypothetical protein
MASSRKSTPHHGGGAGRLAREAGIDLQGESAHQARGLHATQSLMGAVFAAVAAGHLEIYARVEFAVRD